MSDVPPQYPGSPYYPSADPRGDYPGYPQGGYGWATGLPSAPVGPPPPADDLGAPDDGASRPSPRRTAFLPTAIVAALIGGGVGAGTVALLGNHSTTVNAGLTLSSRAAPAPNLDGSVSAAAAKIRPSVVTIDVANRTEADTGSGVIIRQDGYILTNNHVVANAAKDATIVVTLADGRRAAGSVVGTDQSDDLAVVRVKLTGLTTATFASSSNLVVGQTVVAVGAPLGLSDTVTSGIVSSTARPVSTGDSQSSLAVFDAVQTDAAINPGNSGGPLVDLNGAVVGINAAIATDQSQGGLQIPGQSSQSGNIGIGFAIPSDEASRIAAELIATGKATHALLGVSVRDASTTESVNAPVGAVVSSVKAGSPAAGAGMKPGDIVTLLAGQRIDSADALVAAVRSHAPNQTVAISYVRGGSSHTIQVKLVASSS